jgi:hypothetical protein
LCGFFKEGEKFFDFEWKIYSEGFLSFEKIFKYEEKFLLEKL